MRTIHTLPHLRPSIQPSRPFPLPPLPLLLGSKVNACPILSRYRIIVKKLFAQVINSPASIKLDRIKT